MTGLMDIAPLKEPVPIQGETWQIGGITLLGLSFLLKSFPEAKTILDGKDATITVDRLFEAGPGVIAALVADGCGYGGNPDAIAKAASLQVVDQVAILVAMLKVSLKDGVGPLLANVRVLTAVLGGVGESMKSPASK